MIIRGQNYDFGSLDFPELSQQEIQALSQQDRLKYQALVKASQKAKKNVLPVSDSVVVNDFKQPVSDQDFRLMRLALVEAAKSMKTLETQLDELKKNQSRLTTSNKVAFSQLKTILPRIDSLGQRFIGGSKLNSQELKEMYDGFKTADMLAARLNIQYTDNNRLNQFIQRNNLGRQIMDTQQQKLTAMLMSVQGKVGIGFNRAADRAPERFTGTKGMSTILATGVASMVPVLGPLLALGANIPSVSAWLEKRGAQLAGKVLPGGTTAEQRIDKATNSGELIGLMQELQKKDALTDDLKRRIEDRLAEIQVQLETGISEQPLTALRGPAPKQSLLDRLSRVAAQIGSGDTVFGKLGQKISVLLGKDGGDPVVDAMQQLSEDQKQQIAELRRRQERALSENTEASDRVALALERQIETIKAGTTKSPDEKAFEERQLANQKAFEKKLEAENQTFFRRYLDKILIALKLKRDPAKGPGFLDFLKNIPGFKAIATILSILGTILDTIRVLRGAVRILRSPLFRRLVAAAGSVLQKFRRVPTSGRPLRLPPRPPVSRPPPLPPGAKAGPPPAPKGPPPAPTTGVPPPAPKGPPPVPKGPPPVPPSTAVPSPAGARGAGILRSIKGVPIIGGLISAGFTALEVLPDDSKTTAEKTGAIAGSGAGAIAGTAAGAALGAQIGILGGPIGIAVGTVVGGAIGGIMGSDLGQALGEGLGTAYDSLVTWIGESGALDSVFALYEQAIDATTKGFEWVASSYDAVVDAASRNIIEPVAEAGSWIKDKFGKAGESLGAAFSTTFGSGVAATVMTEITGKKPDAVTQQPIPLTKGVSVVLGPSESSAFNKLWDMLPKTLGVVPGLIQQGFRYVTGSGGSSAGKDGGKGGTPIVAAEAAAAQEVTQLPTVTTTAQRPAGPKITGQSSSGTTRSSGTVSSDVVSVALADRVDTRPVNAKGLPYWNPKDADTYGALKDPAFVKGSKEMAERLGISHDDVMSFMMLESQLDPKAVNQSSGASGLIQFMPQSAIEVGTTVEDIRKMTAAEQLPYIEKYLLQRGVKPGMGIAELYASVLVGNAAAGRKETWFDSRSASALERAKYEGNKGLDLNDKYGNKDGVVDRTEVLKKLEGDYAVSRPIVHKMIAEAERMSAVTAVPEVDENFVGPVMPEMGPPTPSQIVPPPTQGAPKARAMSHSQPTLGDVDLTLSLEDMSLFSAVGNHTT